MTIEKSPSHERYDDAFADDDSADLWKRAWRQESAADEDFEELEDSTAGGNFRAWRQESVADENFQTSCSELPAIREVGGGERFAINSRA